MTEVKILSHYCKGCGYCVDVCSKNVLELGREINELGYIYPVAIRQKDCIACNQCTVVCPDSAIEIYQSAKGEA